MSAVLGATIEVKPIGELSVKDLERKPHQEQLRSLGLLSVEETQVRPQGSPQLPHRQKQRGRH